MKKRTFLKIAGVSLASYVLVPHFGCKNPTQKKDSKQTMLPPFTLPDLPYDYNALETNIDARTMEIHHSKHHAGYVKKLSAAVVGSAFAGMSLEEVFPKLTMDDDGVRNNGGGHFNHSLFWKNMSPAGKGKPEGDLLSAIQTTFGDFETFRKLYWKEAKTVFGSGWAWLCKDSENKLFITSTPNQDNPLMTKLVEKTGTPLLALDVWEHAYYLKYQNRRGDYIDSFFNVINWDEVSRRFNE